MTCSLVVNSKSGNTRMVSGAIKRALQTAGVEFIHAAALSDDADADQVALEAQGACAADTVLVGFWCDKGACTPSVAALLSALHGKRVFLFGTCGFGASEEYFRQIIDRVTSNLANDAELAGWAMCQGKMGPAASSATRQCSSKIPTMSALRCCSITGSPQRTIPPRRTWVTWPQPPRRPCWASSFAIRGASCKTIQM